MIAIMIILFLALILIGVPIAWGTGLATLFYIQTSDSIPVMLLAHPLLQRKPLRVLINMHRQIRTCNA